MCPSERGGDLAKVTQAVRAQPRRDSVLRGPGVPGPPPASVRVGLGNSLSSEPLGLCWGCSVTPRSGTLLSSSRPGGGPRARRWGTSRLWLVPQARGSLPGPGWPGCQTSQLPLAVTVVLGGGIPLRPQRPPLCPRAHLQLCQPLCSSHPKALPVYFRRPDHAGGLLPNSHPSSHLSYIP